MGEITDPVLHLGTSYGIQGESRLRPTRRGRSTLGLLIYDVLFSQFIMGA